MSWFSLIFASILACWLQEGYALQCYSCAESMQGSSVKVSSCKSPKSQWNITECPESEGKDRCTIYRMTDTKDGAKVTTEVRSCLSAAQCVNTWLMCEEAKKYNRGQCDMKCCKDNLCNEKDFEQPKYEFFEPLSTNLSCYTCSDFPKGSRLPSSPLTPDCSNPIKQQCGKSFPQYLTQDRCITLKVKAIESENATSVMNLTYRGCSNIFQCSYTDVLWGYELNETSKGDGHSMRYISASSSCCHGNLCNATSTTDKNNEQNLNNASRISTGFTGLTGLIWFIVVALLAGYTSE